MTEEATKTPPRLATEKQMEVLRFVQDFCRRHDYGCGVRDIADFLNSKNPNAAMCHIIPLEKKGLLKRTPGKARSIRPIREVL
jgi:SOS-response transcriptional repressor LexA